MVIALDISISAHNRYRCPQNRNRGGRNCNIGGNETLEQLYQEFLVRVVDTMDIGPQRSLVGIIYFAEKAQFHIDLDQYTSKTSLINAIRNLQVSEARGTNFLPVLELFNNSANDRSSGFRPNFPKAGVIVTDG